MRLIKLKLVNYCQYDNLVTEFEDGVTILRGKNGSGKTNFVNAIYFSLTGDSCVDKKTRSGMLKWGTDKGYTELTFEVHNQVYKIKRMLNSSTVSLTGGDLDKKTGSKESTEYIAKLVNADPEVLKLSSFMPQAGASELVFGTKTERQKAFSRLFRLLHLEVNRTDLQKEFNKIPVYPDVSDIIVSLAADIALLESGKKEIEACNVIDYLNKNKDKYQTMYDARNIKYTEAEYNAEQARLVTEIMKQEAYKKKCEEDRDGLPEFVDVTPEESEKYRGFKEFETTCVEMLKAKEKVDNPMIAEFITQAQVNVAQDAYNTEVIKDHARTKELELWKEGKCDKCGSVFEHTPDEIAEKSMNIDTLRAMPLQAAEVLNSLKIKLDLFRKAKLVNQADTDAYLLLEKQVIGKSHIYDNYDEKVFLAKQNASRANSDTLAKDAELLSHIDRARALIASANEQSAELKATGFKPANFSQEFLKEYTREQQIFQDLEQKKVAIETALKLKTESIVQRRKEQKLAVLAERHRKFITDIRTVLHVDNYPRLAVALKKEKLGIIINKYLDIFNQRFTINIDDSLAFICVFSENPEAKADELSGGQKAMLLVSVRLAIAEMLASDVELLTFDEPGAAMDKDAKQDLLEAFDTVRKYLAGQRVQMLVASHDDNIEGIADSVIQL